MIHHGSHEKGVQRVIDYVCDEAKTHEATFEENKSDKSCVRNALEYIDNGKKTLDQYVSGYLCDPEMAEQEFRLIAEDSADAKGRTIADEDFACYHIVQSLDKELRIDPAEMQEMGQELLQRLENGKYPAVIATHCQLVFNEEDGKWHGE